MHLHDLLPYDPDFLMIATIAEFFSATDRCDRHMETGLKRIFLAQKTTIFCGTVQYIPVWTACAYKRWSSTILWNMHLISI